jgi:3-oxoacyl-[acyl-carrier protein] reductase
MDFKDKRVLITGGTRGIGRETALAFAAQGARVAVTYASDTQSAAHMQDFLNQGSSEHLLIQADVREKTQVEAMVAKILDRWEGIDVLINNAGIHRDKLLMFLSETDWDDVLDTNLRGTFLCSQAVLKPMIGQRWGRIINIASPSGIAGRTGQANYSASKGGVIAFTKSMSKELAKIGITVNAISPGVIYTSLTEKLDQEVKDDLIKLIPMGRFGEPREIAAMILFVASDEAAYITGQVIAVDGGLT